MRQEALTAIKPGVKEGVYERTEAAMIRDLGARVEALEAKAQLHDDAIEAIHTRLAALETWHPTPRDQQEGQQRPSQSSAGGQLA